MKEAYCEFKKVYEDCLAYYSKELFNAIPLSEMEPESVAMFMYMKKLTDASMKLAERQIDIMDKLDKFIDDCRFERERLE